MGMVHIRIARWTDDVRLYERAHEGGFFAPSLFYTAFIWYRETKIVPVRRSRNDDETRKQKHVMQPNTETVTGRSTTEEMTGKTHDELHT